MVAAVLGLPNQPIEPRTIRGIEINGGVLLFPAQKGGCGPSRFGGVERGQDLLHPTADFLPGEEKALVISGGKTQRFGGQGKREFAY